MRLLRRLIAIGVLLGLVPGVGELIENTGHLALHGDLAHAGSHGDEDAGAEHGCTGVFHLCACHNGPAVALPSCERPAPAVAEAEQRPARGTLPEPGATAGVFRPPRA